MVRVVHDVPPHSGTTAGARGTARGCGRIDRLSIEVPPRVGRIWGREEHWHHEGRGRRVAATLALVRAAVRVTM